VFYTPLNLNPWMGVQYSGVPGRAQVAHGATPEIQAHRAGDAIYRTDEPLDPTRASRCTR
jgi:hypothetical protein